MHMHVSKSSVFMTSHSTYSLGQQPLATVEVVKNLGVLVDT